MPVRSPLVLLLAVLAVGAVAGAQTAGKDAGPAESAGPRPLTDRGLENLVGFTRLLGYVRHFHPGDAAGRTDWETVAVAAVPRVEAAKDPEELARVLTEIFAPSAAAVDVFPGAGKEPPLPEGLIRVPGRRGVRIVYWEQHGFAQAKQRGPYFRTLRRYPVRRGAARGAKESAPHPARPFVAGLGGGVTCRVPLALYQYRGKTVPAPGGTAGRERVPTTARDRSVRLAAVALAWNVFQHFYPYFDVVDARWPAALEEALRAAAVDPDEEAFLATLRRMVAHLKDGHGYVWHPSDRAVARLPLSWAWVGDRLVVTHVSPSAAPEPASAPPERGDVVLEINGEPVEELRARVEPLLSAATPQHLRFRLAAELSRFPLGEVVRLGLARGGRSVSCSFVLPRHVRAAVTEPRPPKIHEIRPGIHYVDLDRVKTEEFTEAVGRLAGARGIVFDLRGYPDGLSTIVLSHLIDEPIQCARWLVPVVTRPDRTNMTFTESRWEVQPRSPRLRARVAFVTDGRAISYAETYLGMVEHYKLGEIVGEATAGTNGNINPFTVPGGYRIIWTGMKVLKHDGSRHHGVGILPTVPVERTLQGVAAGRDELLEKAIEVVAGGR